MFQRASYLLIVNVFLPTCVLCCFVGSLCSVPDGCLLTDEHSCCSLIVAQSHLITVDDPALSGSLWKLIHKDHVKFGVGRIVSASSRAQVVVVLLTDHVFSL